MEESELSEHERLHIQQIRELDLEELQVEIIGDDSDVSSDEDDGYSVLRVQGDGGSEQYRDFTHNTSLPPLHSYLGETDDIRGRMTYFDGGVTLTIAMFYLEGVVLFPEAVLPLRVIRPELKASVQKALNQVEAPFIIGVVGTTRPTLGSIRFGTIGTTAEIRQYKCLDDGALNVVARGQQRFYLQRQWTDVEGAECAEVQIIQEDTPLRTPKNAFAQLASTNNIRSLGVSSSVLPNVSCSDHIQDNVENEWDCFSKANTQSDQSPRDLFTFRSPHDSPSGMFDDSSVSDDEFLFERKEILGKSFLEKLDASHHAHYKMNECESTVRDSLKQCTSTRKSEVKVSKSRKLPHMSKHAYKAPLSFWPHWVYEIYDSYSLAQRVAGIEEISITFLGR
ncbi:Protein cereblon [Zostera marina]|uniref:Protein cereblon n=1 Tax=Zostera marina TaxID=29655 RepID=A0A0K9NRG4_ZOSMR|nr:Protein cereblon [Zostera marina]